MSGHVYLLRCHRHFSDDTGAPERRCELAPRCRPQSVCEPGAPRRASVLPAGPPTLLRAVCGAPLPL
eukprot:3228022-Alexandrium_andersonii.AAC.1